MFTYNQHFHVHLKLALTLHSHICSFHHVFVSKDVSYCEARCQSVNGIMFLCYRINWSFYFKWDDQNKVCNIAIFVWWRDREKIYY